MALHWQPVGPESAQTYWVRRAVVAAAVLVPVLLLLSLLGGDDGDERLRQDAAVATPAPLMGPTLSAGPSPDVSGMPQATPGPSASPGVSTSPGASASPSGTASPTASAVACTDDALTVEAAATEDSYAVGARARLELRVTNTGTAPCSRDLGQAAVELQVVSGADRIWSSDDCAPGGDADVTVLQPGTPEISTVTWSGTRSRPGCEGDEERASAGTYRVNGRVGELREQGQPFVLR